LNAATALARFWERAAFNFWHLRMPRLKARTQPVVYGMP
jgi:hypothetical protein